MEAEMKQSDKMDWTRIGVLAALALVFVVGLFVATARAEEQPTREIVGGMLCDTPEQVQTTTIRVATQEIKWNASVAITNEEANKANACVLSQNIAIANHGKVSTFTAEGKVYDIIRVVVLGVYVPQYNVVRMLPPMTQYMVVVSSDITA